MYNLVNLSNSIRDIWGAVFVSNERAWRSLYQPIARNAYRPALPQLNRDRLFHKMDRWPIDQGQSIRFRRRLWPSYAHKHLNSLMNMSDIVSRLCATWSRRVEPRDGARALIWQGQFLGHGGLFRSIRRNAIRPSWEDFDFAPVRMRSLILLRNHKHCITTYTAAIRHHYIIVSIFISESSRDQSPSKQEKHTNCGGTKAADVPDKFLFAGKEVANPLNILAHLQLPTVRP